MRILHINCNYLGTTLHQLMIEGLTRQRIENEVFVPVYDKSLTVIKPDKNVCVSECFKKWDRVFFDYKQGKIINVIEKQYDIASFNLIHAYTLFTDGNAARILSERYDIPYAVAVRNTDVNLFLKKRILLRKRGIKTLLSASKIYFLSKSYQNAVIKNYVPEKYHRIILQKSEIIPNGIDDFWLNHKYENRDYNRIIEHIANKRLKLIYAGNIDKNKNITLTCKAVEVLEKDGWKIDFTVVGKIKNKAVFSRIKDQVRYFEARPKEQLIDLYQNADIFVMPSISESFGLVYAEAMTQGLPVLYTEGQGFDGQFPEGFVGFHVSSTDELDLAKKIVQTAKDYVAISKRAINCAEKFNWDKICKKYYQEYEKVINRGVLCQ